MQAAINTHYGSPNVLRLSEMNVPTIGPYQVLIQVHASTVTEGDRRLRAADYPGLSVLFGRLVTGLFRPRNPVGGSTFAGRVTEVGAKVTRFQRGDDVFGSTMNGAYAEYLAISSSDAIAVMPPGLGYGEAAAIPYGGGTALTFLKELADVQRGEQVLIVGASGGVGRIAVQVAKHLGAHVTAVCSSDSELVRQLGADEVINYKEEDFVERAQKWDVILDTTEGDHFVDFRASLSPSGRYLTLYVTIVVLLQMFWTKLCGGQRALTGVALGGPESCDELRDLVEKGALRASIAKRFPLAKMAEAHQFFETVRPHAAVVVDMTQERRVSLGTCTDTGGRKVG